MGLLQDLGSALGGSHLQNLASGQGNFDDANSQDQQHLQTMVSSAPPGVLQQIFSHAAQRMDPQQYADHVTPGVGGTNPLGGIGSGGLATIASALIGKLSGVTGGSGGLANLIGRIPGLRTTDPNQMDPDQVAALSRYTQQNHPDVFGQAAAQVAQQKPDLLHSFLGKAGLAIGAAALASHFIKTGPAGR
jgi:hypothetical protein